MRWCPTLCEETGEIFDYQLVDSNDHREFMAMLSRAKNVLEKNGRAIKNIQFSTSISTFHTGTSITMYAALLELKQL